MTSGQETERVSSYNPGIRTGPSNRVGIIMESPQKLGVLGLASLGWSMPDPKARPSPYVLPCLVVSCQWV